MISVVIPTFNEADSLPRLLASLGAESEAREIIVVDGGSADRTAEIALDHAVQLLTSARGRGRQLNRGAAAARGEVLLFLHADSRFPAGGLAAIRSCLEASPGVIGGNFRLCFDGDDRFSRWLDGFYRWIRARGLYYGDSAIFVRRQAYRALGGIRPIALMEDYDLTRRMERLGETCCIADPPLMTSSRRFAGRHPLAIVAGWLTIHALYHMGVAPERLARLYDSDRRRGTGAVSR